MQQNKYIFDGAGVIVAPEDWYNSLEPENFTDNYDGLIQGKYMHLTQEQIDFYLAHPTYDLYHLYHMIPVSAEEQNRKIEEVRRKLYTKQSDPIYMSYIKYKELGMTDKADEAYTQWKDKLKTIELENPYVEETGE